MDEHTFWGLTGEYLIAGFSGGYVYSFFMHQYTPREVIGSVLSGGFFANYVGLMIANKTGAPPLAACFFTGLIWNVLCHAVLSYANSNLSKGRRHD